MAPLEDLRLLLEHGPPSRFANERQELAHRAESGREIPPEIPVGRGMIEVRQRDVNLGDASPEILEQRGRPVRHRDQRDPGDPRQQADQVLARRFENLASVDTGHDARAHAAARRDLLHRGVLCVEHGARFGRVRDLEDEASIWRVELEVLVAFARQHARHGVEAVEIPRKADRLVDVELRRVLYDGHGVIVVQEVQGVQGVHRGSTGFKGVQGGSGVQRVQAVQWVQGFKGFTTCRG